MIRLSQLRRIFFEKKNNLEQELNHVNQGQLLKLISLIDLTSLDNCDTESSIKKLVEKANSSCFGVYPAAVCAFANFGDLVRKNLNPSIKTAVVGSCFPSSQTLSAAKIAEANLISQTAVDELDIVINRGDFFDEKYDQISHEISRIKQALKEKTLKVILETGDLKTEKSIKLAAELAIESGADFIKTSTGKTSQGASPDAVRWMCEVIKIHHINTGIKIGIKPSGGIKTIDDALVYYNIVQEELGEDWLTPSLFRIGASSLYDQLKTVLLDK
jgi:deoxyribose-phosphate aldolase